MNIAASLFCFLSVFAFIGIEVFPQSSEKLIVLVRHTEKDSSPSADKMDPELSVEGRERAVRLMHAIKKYKPHEIFSTGLKRTLSTAEPIATRRKIAVQTYNPQKHSELVEKIMVSNTKRYFIVGHSNTIPLLANLLAKKEVFRPLLESEYGIFWVIRMKKGVLTRVEVFTY